MVVQFNVCAFYFMFQLENKQDGIKWKLTLHNLSTYFSIQCWQVRKKVISGIFTDSLLDQWIKVGGCFFVLKFFLHVFRYFSKEISYKLRIRHLCRAVTGSCQLCGDVICFSVTTQTHYRGWVSKCWNLHQFTDFNNQYFYPCIKCVFQMCF